MSTMADIERFVTLDARRRELEEELKGVKASLRTAAELVHEHFREGGLQSIKTAGGMTVYIHRQVWAGREEDVPWTEVAVAMRRAGLGDYIEPKFNVQSFSAWVREQEREGLPLPPELTGVIKVTEQFDIRTRKGD